MISIVGLMAALKPGRGEVAGVDGPGQGQRHGQQHGVERPLERAENQRHEAQLGLEVVAAGRLPGVGRLVVAFVMDLAEQGPPTHLGMRGVDLPRPQPAFAVQGRQRGAAQGDSPTAPSDGPPSHEARCRWLVMWSKWIDPSSADAQQRLGAQRGDDLPHRAGVRREGVDPRQPERRRRRGPETTCVNSPRSSPTASDTSPKTIARAVIAAMIGKRREPLAGPQAPVVLESPPGDFAGRRADVERPRRRGPWPPP